ncbi:MAG TPA: LysR family transcriptional regulator [Burkholderiaceae bacterium]|nr:LysR family transcriptional regulator [Burkholderiaceae bacterium]
MLSRRELTLLRAMYQCGTVTAAAASVHMTQPAASALLRTMETRLGFALFSRQNRRLQLTSQGRALIPDVLNALAGMEAVDKLAGDIRQGSMSRLVIGAVAIAASSIVPPALALVRREHPGIAVTVRAGTAIEIIEMAVDQRIDLGIIVGALVEKDRVASRALAPMSLYAVMNPGHPWAGRQELSLEDVAQDGPIVLATTLPAGRVTRQVIEAAALPYQPIMEVGQSSAACALAEQGLGIAIVETLGARYARRLGLVARHLLAAPEIGLVLVWPNDRILSEPAETLRNSLIAEGESVV